MNRTTAWQLLCYGLLVGAALPCWGQVERGGTTTAATPPGAAGRQVSRASCVLQLDFDANQGNRNFDLQTLNALLSSSAIVDVAAERALKLSPEQWPAIVQLEVVPAGNSAVRLGVVVTQDAQTKLPPNAARVMLDELASRAKLVVDSSASQRAKARAERRAALDAELAAGMKALDAASAKLREAQSGDAGRVGRFQNQPGLDRDGLEINLISQRARLAAMEVELKRMIDAVAAARPPAGAPAPSPWAELIAAREKIVAFVREQKAAGLQTELALMQAEASLLETRALAASAERQDRRDLPAERLQAEVVNLRASIAESEAKLAALNERFPKPATRPGEPAVDVEQLRHEEAAARERVSELKQLIQARRREEQNAQSGPTLNILDGRSLE